MQQTNFYIKGMVCDRCIASVKETFEALGIGVARIGLGEVVLTAPLTVDESVIGSRLADMGFELIRDPKRTLVADVKVLAERVYDGNFDFPYNFRFTSFAETELKMSQAVISADFLSIEGITLEQFLINLRMSRVREMLVNTSRTLNDISYSLGFSSAAHLSKQFKQHTGCTPSQFRHLHRVEGKRWPAGDGKNI